jgi:predicted TIM-barrel fold metal-dependent hydrolase
MYEKNGEKYFVVDGHVHFWDASPENQANRYGEGFINCFYDYHRNLSPEEYVWSLERFQKYDEDGMVRDLFEIGYADVAIFQPTYLSDFYRNGFNTTEQDAAVAEKHPGRFIVNGAFDPRNGESGLEEFERKVERHKLKGVKLYTAEWKGDSKGWKLHDPWSLRYLEKCQELGVKNIHIHKGPTIWPLNRDAFDVADVDDAATAFPELNFIVEHVGLPRLEDFCWIGTQEPNVYGGLAVAMPFIHTRPRYFAQVLGELLYWLGEDRILFASDYAIWQPKWLIEQFMALDMPEDLVSEYGQITDDARAKILGLNAAKLYGLDVPAEARQAADGGTGPDVTDKPAVDPIAV